jgi:ABC-type uncharacterized transport system YnjBCD ATPase subunit
MLLAGQFSWPALLYLILVFSEARDRLEEARLLAPFSRIEQRDRGDMISFKGFVGTGELTLFGWLAVILYFSTAMSCWITARKLQARTVDIENVKIAARVDVDSGCIPRARDHQAVWP